MTEEERQFGVSHELREARVVVRDGREIAFCDNERSAGSLVLHLYGLTPWQARRTGAVEIKSIVDRGPQPGDALVDGQLHGVLCHQAGRLAVCYDARAFRAHEHVSVSGGPVPFIEDPTRLRFHGLRDVTFWRWSDDLPGAEKAGHYTMRVPLWTID